MMKVESLANELILDVFEYLDGLDVLRSFYGLNSRLNDLLCSHFRTYSFNFRSISKSNFDLLCEEYLPLILAQVISFHLSDNDETPDLPQSFLSRGFLLDQFIQLKSLSLYAIHSLDVLNQMISQCRSLSHLKHLNLIHFYIDFDEEKTTVLMNDIWSLSLTHCRFDRFYSGGQCFFGINTISRSMNYLSINNTYCDLNVLYHLFEHTPNLRQLSIPTDYNSNDESLITTSSSIHLLKLSFEGSIHSLITLFSHLPTLSSLTLKTSDLYLNGHEWEKVLVDYLPKIQKFRLRMKFQFTNNDNNISTQVDDLLDTFRTDFWIKQHQWFVQCDANSFDSFSPIFLYTLPYDFDDFFYYGVVQSKSTCPNTRKSFSYNRVNTLRHSFSHTLPIESINSLLPKFHRIDDLKISIPFSQDFNSCIVSLNELNALDVLMRENSTDPQLQSLLDRAPHLYSLTIRTEEEFSMDLMKISSPSIRRLDLLSKLAYRQLYFNYEECLILAQSSIGKQCEVLLISVENRVIISELTQMMSNLRSLTVQCRDDKYNQRESMAANDAVLHWLSKHLPSEFVIVRDKQEISRIHIWMK